jgi:hypothetical protein
MSPAVNLDLEEVPFEILETVKARILANRARLSQGQVKPRPSTRPRPQFRKVGASSRSWRMPQHGAGVLGTPDLFIVELRWLDGADYDLNAGANGSYVGWTYYAWNPVNDGTLWNRLFWCGDNVSEGPASEYIIYDKTRQPPNPITHPGEMQSFPGDDFVLELYSYCYERLSTQPLTVSLYSFNPSPEDAFDNSNSASPYGLIGEVDRLKALFAESPDYPLQSYTVTVNRLSPGAGQLGQLIGAVDLSTGELIGPPA